MKVSATIIFIIIILVGSIAAYGATVIQPKEKTIVAFCGSASKPVLEDAAKTFEEKSGMKIELHFGGSGTMMSQMKISKTGDLYIPGSDDYMERAIKYGLVDLETVKVLAYLIPVIIVREGNPENITCLEDLSKPGIKVGIGDPESVCVGEYAVTILEYNNLTDEVEENIVVYAESCSKTASLIMTGSVDAIIGWHVFTNWNPDKSDLVLIRPEGIPKISSIPGAVSTYSENREEAIEFLDFLTSQEGQEIFAKYGYIATLEDARTFAPLAEVPTFRK